MIAKALIHAHPDFVAVATDDISKDEEIIAVFMDDDKQNFSPKQGRYRSGTQNCPKKYWKGRQGD